MIPSRLVIPLVVTVILLPVVLLGGLLGALQVPAVQRWVAREIAANAPVRLEGFAIGWPLNLQADQLTLVDDDGPWLVLSQFRFGWSPAALWGDTLHIRHLAARHLELRRLPSAETSNEKAGPPHLPPLPIDVLLDDLTVEQFTVDPVVGLPAAEGRLSAQGSFIAGHLRAAVVAAVATEGANGQMRVAVDGSDQDLRVVGQAAAHDLPSSLPIRSARLAMAGQVSLTTGDIGVGHLRLDTDRGQASAVGWVRGWGEDCRLHLIGHLPDLSTFGAGVAGSATVLADLSGGLARPRLTASIDPVGLSTGIADVDPLLGDAPHASAAIALDRNLKPGLFVAAVDGKGASARLGGLFRLPLFVGLRLKIDQLEGLSGGLYRGWASAEGMLLGSPDDPSLAARLDGQGEAESWPVRVHAKAAARHLTDQPVGQAQIDLSTDNGLAGTAVSAFQWGPVVRLDRLEIASGADRLNGNLTWDRQRQLAAGRLQAEIGSLGRWAALAGIPSVDGAARIEASLEPGRDQGGAFSVDAAKLRISDVSIRHLTAKGKFTDLFGRPRGQLNLQAEGGDAGRLKIDRLRADANGDLQKMTFALEGTGKPAFAVSAQGLAEPDAGRYGLSALQLTLGPQQLRLTAPTRLEMKGDAVRLAPTVLTVAGSQVRAEGALVGDKIDGDLTFAGLPLAAAQPLLPELRPDGVVSGQLSIGGTRRLPRVTARLSGRQINFGGHHEGIEGAAQANWDGKRIHATLTARGLRGSQLQAEGECPLAMVNGRPDIGDGAITGHADGQADLARLAELVPLGDQTVSGALTLNADISGQVAKPTVDATLRVAGGHYQNLDTGTSLTAIALSATARDSRHITIDIRGSDGGKGNFTATGEADLAGGPSFNANIDMHRLRVVNLDLATADADGAVHFDGAGGQGGVSGHVIIDGGEVDISQALPPRIVTLDVVNVNLPPGKKPGKQPAAEPPFDLTLALEADLHNLHLFGRGLDSQWHGQLAIGGTASAPTLIGQLTSSRGSFEAFGRRLTLTQGSVSFDGNYPPDPRLDIIAQGQAQDISAEVHVTGTANKPDLAFTSDPPLPQDEVLSRLLFGTSFGQLSVLQQLSLAQAAAGQITGGEGGGFDPLGKVKGFLGLDVLQAGSETTNPMSISGLPGVPVAPGSGPNPALAQQTSNQRTIGPSLSAGKYLNNRTFVRVDQGTTGGQVTVEIELGGGFAVETQVGENTGEGAGLRWKKDY